MTPTRKVGASALAGALTVILIWAVGQAGLDVPGEVASAVTVILTFATGWFVTEP